NLSSCLWWLFNKDPGRLYLELQFFCAVANYGQGFLSFGIFGLDRHLIIMPFKKRLLWLWQGRDAEDLSPSGVPEEVRLTCTQFVRYHKDQCVQDIVHTRRCGGGGGGRLEEEEEEEEDGAVTHSSSHITHHQEQLNHDLHQIHQTHLSSSERCGPSPPPARLPRPPRPPRLPRPLHSDGKNQPPSSDCEEQIQQLQSGYDPADPPHQHDLPLSPPRPRPPQTRLRSVFWGSALVDWLLERGLCAGRAEARLYGVRLQQGGVLDHLTGQHAFRDAPFLLYRFTQAGESGRAEAWSHIM
ncbi:integral membrane protein GPR155-like, partial [Plectropomus leopardus]|uniref:integral membrane protein GPR155-like n=1 Tax=Plectropomus leopardus TaxID=160734 RepID=UPI001C4D9370